MKIRWGNLSFPTSNAVDNVTINTFENNLTEGIHNKQEEERRLRTSCLRSLLDALDPPPWPSPLMRIEYVTVISITQLKGEC